MATGELTTKTAADFEADYCRFVRMRNRAAKTGPGEYYAIQAKNLASVLLTLSADAKVIAGKISLQDRTGSQLDEVGRPVSEGGIGCPRPDASGSSGSVTISATASGTHILAGDELTTEAGVAFQCTTDARYYDGGQVPVICKETGPDTNLPPGTKLTWSNPRPGCYAVATVYEQLDGTGLTGGAEQMGDDDYRRLLAETQANPSAGANVAYLQRLIRDTKAHRIAVEEAFVYPCAEGPTVSAFTFTVKGSVANGSRLPNATQLNTVAAYVEQYMPCTDGIIKLPLADDDMKHAFRVTWSVNGWENVSPWPAWKATSSRHRISLVSSATSFRIAKTDGVYTSEPAPVAGTVIALFDEANGKIVKKTIATVSGTGPWIVTCETLNAASDTVYVPIVGQWVSPWSDSLQLLVDEAISFANAMGPGEILETLPEDGQRGARYPADMPRQWPSQMDSSLQGAISQLSPVKRVSHEDGSDYTCTVGDATVAYLPRLSDFAVYPL